MREGKAKTGISKTTNNTETTVTESRRQNRQKIHTRKGGTHRPIARECGAQNIALPTRRRDAKHEGGGTIMADNSLSECRNVFH